MFVDKISSRNFVRQGRKPQVAVARQGFLTQYGGIFVERLSIVVLGISIGGQTEIKAAYPVLV